MRTLSPSNEHHTGPCIKPAARGRGLHMALSLADDPNQPGTRTVQRTNQLPQNPHSGRPHHRDQTQPTRGLHTRRNPVVRSSGTRHCDSYRRRGPTPHTTPPGALADGSNAQVKHSVTSRACQQEPEHHCYSQETGGPPMVPRHSGQQIMPKPQASGASSRSRSPHNAHG